MNNKLIISIGLIGLMGFSSMSFAMSDDLKTDYRAYVEDEDINHLQEEIAELYSRKEQYLRGLRNTQQLIDMARDETTKEEHQE